MIQEELNMPKQITQAADEHPDGWELEYYFVATGFCDLLPLAVKLTKDLGYNQTEMINAVCKVYDKFVQYPPTQNRTAWFKKVFEEKLPEARSDILAFEVMNQRLASDRHRRTD